MRDLVLVGRGAGAGQLARLRAGQRLTADVSLSQDVAMAITGNTFLVRDGVRVASDDVDLHPRTAIGIDRDTGQLLLLVVDGRQELSRGLTMKELAKLFQRLGAEDALNLDGGGSSIMVARQVDGSLAVLNSPSDGHPRPVANGLEVTYDVVPPPADQRTRGRTTSATVVIGAKHSICGLGTLTAGDHEPGPGARHGHVGRRVAADGDHRAVQRLPFRYVGAGDGALDLLDHVVALELRVELLPRRRRHSGGSRSASRPLPPPSR